MFNTSAQYHNKKLLFFITQHRIGTCWTSPVFFTYCPVVTGYTIPIYYFERSDNDHTWGVGPEIKHLWSFSESKSEKKLGLPSDKRCQDILVEILAPWYLVSSYILSKEEIRNLKLWKRVNIIRCFFLSLCWNLNWQSLVYNDHTWTERKNWGPFQWCLQVRSRKCQPWPWPHLNTTWLCCNIGQTLMETSSSPFWQLAPST